MKRCFARVLLFALLALAVLNGQQQPVDVLLNKARALEGRGRIDLAAQTWQRVLTIDSKQQEALAGMARYSKQQGMIEEAAKYVDRLRAVNPRHAGIAQAESTQVISQNRARLEEAAKLAANNQPVAAMAIYREVFGNDPLPGAWTVAYHETDAATPGGWERAVAALQRLTAEYPTVLDYKVSLGKLLTYKPDTRARGIRMLEEIRGDAGAAARAKEAWRRALIWDGSKVSNAAAIKSYLARYPDPELQKIASQIAPADGPREGLARSKDEIQAFETLNTKDVDAAEAQFKAILKESPQNVPALAGMGYVHMKRQEFAAALENFEAARAGAPDNRTLAEAVASARFWNSMSEGTKAAASANLEEAQTLYQEALSLRPESVEAMQGLAGVLMRRRMPARAVPLLETLTRANPKDASLWRLLVIAQKDAGGPKAAIETANRIPPAAQLALSKDLEFPAMLSSAYEDLGDLEQASRRMAETIELAEAEKLTLPTPIKLQFAGLHLKLNHPSQAEQLYRSAAQFEPSNAVAWEGLTAALVKQGKEADAYQAMQRMPPPVFETALKSPGFLRVAAAVQAKFGRLDSAEEMMRRVLDSEADTGPQLDTQVQLAGIWMQQGQYAKAQRLLGQLADSHANDEEVWKMLLASMSRSKKFKQAAETMNRIPMPVLLRLQDDPGFVSIAAGIRSGVGEDAEALDMVRTVVARLQQEKETVPADLSMQMAWLLLNTRADDSQLYDTLVRLSRDQSLTPPQKKDYNEIWTLWSLRRAGELRDAGDYARATAILDAAGQLVPRDYRLTAALAGIYLASGDTARAFRIYRGWGLAGGQAYDFTSAVGAAMAQKDPIAWQWIEQGLRKYPRSADLLNLAGKLAAQQGDYKQAERYWRSAITASQLPDGPGSHKPASGPLPALNPARPEAPTRDAEPNPVKGLGPLLIGRRDDAVPAPPAAGGRDPFLPRDTRGRAMNASYENSISVDVKAISQFRSSSADRVAPAETIGLPRIPESVLTPEVDRSAARPAAIDTLAPEMRTESTLQRELQDQINAVQSRNTPYFSARTVVEGRSGRPGFEQRMLQEAEFETSTVIGERVRATLIARPTYISTQGADGTGAARLGLLPKGTAFDSMSASGVGAEVQLSTETLGLRFGSTPRGFLVSNLFGSLRFQPAGGPITFLVSRDPVRDTMLSFAGVREPVTGQITGGVVADSVTVKGNWGGARSGFYASGGYQRLTGMNVLSNSRIDATAGGYWRVASLPYGDLTAGFTVFGMGYSKNLRYFTLGQGGYFSPQRYLLLGVPIGFRGQHKRVEYDISGTLGSQSFREDTSPYFPMARSLQAVTGLSYAGQNVTSLNFSFDSQVRYRLTPTWQFVGFISANNARNFTAASIGASLVYTFRPSSLTPVPFEHSVPDWRGRQPFDRRDW